MGNSTLAEDQLQSGRYTPLHARRRHKKRPQDNYGLVAECVWERGKEMVKVHNSFEDFLRELRQAIVLFPPSPLTPRRSHFVDSV